MSTSNLTCPKCGKTARCVYLDMPKRNMTARVVETERLMLAARPDYGYSFGLIGAVKGSGAEKQ